uniref:TOG domain-containing protein n=1 Tax=Rhodnius prolixus TaxID=13249 RepID=T1HV74_RHOPR
MEEDDYSKLPIIDKCVHKLWKARFSGYENAADLFRKLDEESPEWNKYAGLIKNFVTDSNAPAQEKGLEAALAFVENCSSASKTVGDVMRGLVQKCVSAPKAKTKDLAIQLALKYIELEKQDVVLDELIKGTENKNPKISATCIHIINIALQEFGAKVINVNVVLKRLPALLEDRDKSVRDEAKACVVELYRWLGPSVQSHLTSLKPTQIADIEAEFEKQKQVEAKPKRTLKSQQINTKQNESTLPHILNAETDMVSCDIKIDPYEFLDPVDVLSVLPQNFYSQLEEKKWSERKEALEGLAMQLSAAPKIENADYSELLRALKKVIHKDANIVVIGVAIKCIAGLANGLKKNFNNYSSLIMPCLFERFKEKKPNIVTALRDAVDAVYLSTSLEQVLEDVISYLRNKNPNVKTEVAFFLARCFNKSSPVVLNKKLLKPLTSALLISLNDQDQTVRDSAANALGVAMMVTGEKAIGPFLSEVDNLKMTKIKECYETAAIEKSQQNTIAVETKTFKKSKAEIKQSVPKSSLSKCHESNPTCDVRMDDAEKLAAIIPQEIRSGLVGHDMDKISAYKKLKDFVEILEKSKCAGVLTFLYRDDIKQISGAEVKFARIDVINRIVNIIDIPKNVLEETVLEIGGCLHHKETADVASETLSKITKKFSLNCITKLLLSRNLEDHPILWAETLRWISSNVLKERDSVDSELLIEYGKKALNQSDALVRNAALALIGTLHMQAGKVDLKNDEFPPRYESGVLSRKTTSKNDRRNLPTANPVTGKCTKEDQVKYFEIQITEQLISDLMDKNWKTRSEAVVKLHSEVKKAGHIAPELGEVPPILAARLSDSNSKIAVATVALIESLAEGMGPNCKQHTSTFLPPLIKLVGDSKVWVRTAALSCLKKWYDIGGYKEFFEGDIIAEALKCGSPSLRTELWNFLSSRLPNIPPRTLSKEELISCLPTLFANIEDRNAEVRKSASDAVLGFMIHLGYNTLDSAYEAVKGNGNSNVKLLLEKTRGNLPANLTTSKNKPDTAKSTTSRTTKDRQSSSKNAKLSKSKENTRSTNARDKTETESDAMSLLPINNLKNQRVIDEQKLKTLKWNFTSPRTEYIDLLKELMISANINKNLIFNMFHNDFRYHLKAIDSLSDSLSSNDLIPLTCNLDLILRWLSLRFFDTNPSVLLKSLEYLNAAFSLLATNGYQLLDYEANSFIPYLILKFGDSKDSVRNSVRALFKQISNLFPVTKQFVFIMGGIKSKNSRQRSECLDHLGWIIENYGMSVCQPNVPFAIREISRHIADRDTNVRNAAINCIVAAYFLEGEKIIKMVGDIAGKDKCLLEERIKRVSRNRPYLSAKPINQINETAPEINVQEQTQPLENPEEKAEMSYEDLRLSGETVLISNSEDGNNLNSEQSVTLQSGKIKATGPLGLDQQFLDEIERDSLSVTQPQIVEVDIEFLKEPVVKPTIALNQATNVKPTLLQLTQKSSLQRVIIQISDSDIQKAYEAIRHIDMVLNTDKRIQLEGYVDLTVVQIVHQLTYLEHNCLPEDMTHYTAIFSFLMRLLNYPDLYLEITENSVYKLLHQLILFMAKRRLQGYDRQEMTVRTSNNLILRFIDQLNKTNILCALINLLYDSFSDSSVPSLYKDLVLKCLWKLNRAQPDWDLKLDYKRVLMHINIFFKEYPSSWWKMQESEIPLRTIRTILFTMVKIRGVQVQKIAKNLPEISQNGELYLYIKKLIRQSNNTITSEVQSSSKESTSEAKVELNSSQKLSTDIQEEVDQIFKKMGKGDANEIPDGVRKLYALKNAHPEININKFLATVSPSLKERIEMDLANIVQPNQ